MPSSVSLQVKNLKFEISDDKPNWMPFTGTCMFVDVPSDGVPDGGVDKPVMFPKDEVEKSLDTFKSMGVNCRWDDWMSPSYALTGHDSQNKVGVITEAEIVGNEVVIKGGLWEWDFYALCETIKLAKESLGWSIECQMSVKDSGDYITAYDVSFVGCALMYSDAAAFKQTYLAAQAKKDKGVDKHMTPEEMKALLGEVLGAVTKNFETKFAEVVEKVDKVSTEFEAQKAAQEAERVALAEKQKAAKAKADEDARVAAELAAKEKAEREKDPQRQTSQFGIVLGKFEGVSDEAKAVVADDKLTGSQKFQQLIQLKLAETKKSV